MIYLIQEINPHCNAQSGNYLPPYGALCVLFGQHSMFYRNLRKKGKLQAFE